jgi:hypothetical protein
MTGAESRKHSKRVFWGRIKSKITLPQVLTGYCPCCGQYFQYPSNWYNLTRSCSVKRFKIVRQNTAYVEDSSNWFYGCKGCAEENEAYWKSMWDDYYGGRL